MIYSTVRSISLVSLVFYLSPIFCGRLLLAPEPIVHNIMQDNFAQDLMKKRSYILKAGGNYPAAIVGGSVETRLMKEVSTGFNPEIKNIFFNTVLCLDQYAMLALEFKHAKTSELNRFALLVGDYSKYDFETNIGPLALPFKLYAALGRFRSPMNTPRSAMIGAYKHNLELFMPSDFEPVTGVLIGLQKDFGACVVGLEVMPKNKKEVILSPQVKYSGLSYTADAGANFNAKETRLHGKFKKDAFTVSAQYRLKGRDSHSSSSMSSKKSSRSSRSSSRAPHSRTTASAPGIGHLEASVPLPLPVLALPSELVLGYGWLGHFMPTKESNNAGFAGLNIQLSKHVLCRMGAKIVHKSKKFQFEKSIISIDINF